MPKKAWAVFISVCFVFTSLSAQLKVYPVNWWVGMKDPAVQLLLHKQGIGNTKISMSPYAGVKLTKTFVPENKNYAFIDLNIAPGTKPGKLSFTVKDGGDVSVFTYELKQRNAGNGKTRVKGVNSSDLIYLIMPDRFSNGDNSNDKISSLRDSESDRSNPFLHHGGDLKGVQNHLDYLKDLGVTSIWLTPVVENDMPLMNEWKNKVSGYHGYWFTDHYTIDARYGGNKAYHEMIEAAHSKGMKVIQDAVYNAVGSYHWSILDLPMNDWINQWPVYTNSNHKEEVFYDPYVDSMDKEIMIRGWFVPHLPDLNLANPYCANYMVEQAIWTTEEFGIDGWRVDTYKYCDEKFMNRVNAALEREFPAITIFGEAWCANVPGSAYFTKNNMNVPFKHNLQGVTDFPFSFAIRDASRRGGVNNLYSILAQDFLYKNPMTNCIFLDNHDMDRFYSVLEENLSKYKIAVGLLLTERGIPQMYYGTEILMKNLKNPSDAAVREDFPGGWNEDSVNKFKPSSRTQLENEAFSYVKTLANFRKNSTALTVGKTLQYQPSDDLYVFFRYTDKQRVMCIVNSSDKTVDLKLDRFSKGLAGKTKGFDVTGKKEINLASSISVLPTSIQVIELK
jgi:neopullulanase